MNLAYAGKQTGPQNRSTPAPVLARRGGFCTVHSGYLSTLKRYLVAAKIIAKIENAS